MAVYLVATLEIHDPEAFKPYLAEVPAIIEKYGGRYLARGGDVERMDGDWPIRRMTIIEFPDARQAKRWWNAPEYEKYKAIRERAARTKAVLVSGYSG